MVFTDSLERVSLGAEVIKDLIEGGPKRPQVIDGGNHTADDFLHSVVALWHADVEEELVAAAAGLEPIERLVDLNLVHIGLLHSDPPTTSVADRPICRTC